MTHAIYSQSALEDLSVAQIKAIANQIGAIPDGDKRIKQTWIDAVIAHQTAFSPLKIAAMEAHIEVVTSRAVRAMTEEELFEYEIGQHEAADGMDEDDWDVPAQEATPTPKRAAKSLSALIERELYDSALAQTSPEPTDRGAIEATEPKKVLNRKSTPLGAAIVVGAIVCLVCLLFRTLSVSGWAIVQLGSYVVRSFGKYDPDLDLGYRFEQWRRERKGTVLALAH